MRLGNIDKKRMITVGAKRGIQYDMLFYGTEQEVNDTLKQIEELLSTGDGLL